ncbi:MAG: SPOCS domain-containing protein, partial [Clostridium sp.]
FDAKIVTMPSSKTISNFAVGSYKNTVNGTTFNNTVQSNTFVINVYNPKLAMTKVSNKKYLKIGDTFEYTITIKNVGDTDLINVILTDEMPSALLVQSILVDGSLVAGNLSIGINIGNLAIGQTKIVKLIVKVISGGIGVYRNIAKAKATAILNSGVQVKEILNEIALTSLEEIVKAEIIEVQVEASAEDVIGIEIFNPELTLTKSVNHSYVVVGEKVTYKVVVQNTGDTNLGTAEAPLKIYDVLASSLKFIIGSVRINGILDQTANIIDGINLGSMSVGQINVVTFDAEVLSGTENPIINEVKATFGYLFGDIIEYGTAISNKVSVIAGIIDLELKKEANKTFVVLKDTIEYTVTIKNNGNMDALNVEFVDILPSSVELIDGSFSINGQSVNSVNLSLGVSIGDIKVLETKVVKYTVQVIKQACKGQIINKAKAKYYYRTVDGRIGSMVSEEASLAIDMGISTFKQLSIDREVVLWEHSCGIEEINSVVAEVTIKKTHVIKTMTATSKEGQILTGRKLIVYGELTLIVEYTELEPEQSVHVIEVKMPISTFIILDGADIYANSLDVNALIEGTYFTRVCRDKIF